MAHTRIYVCQAVHVTSPLYANIAVPDFYERGMHIKTCNLSTEESYSSLCLALLLLCNHRAFSHFLAQIQIENTHLCTLVHLGHRFWTVSA